MGKPVRRLIVGHYEKDLSWLDTVPKDWVVTVVTNGKDRPNEGREPGMFLWWIAENYRDIHNEDELVFVQDYPFDHYPDLINRLKDGVYGFEPLGGEFETQSDGRPHHMGLPVAECYERWLGKEWPGSVKFAPGGQFAIRGKRIKRYKQPFYRHLEQEVAKDQNAWVMERLWLSLFG